MTVFDRMYGVITRVYGKMNRTLPDKDKLTENSRLKEELCIDSLMFVLIMLETESEFGVTLPAEKMSECKTVGEVVAIVEKTVKKA